MIKCIDSIDTFHQMTVVTIMYQPVKTFQFLANSFWYTVVYTHMK